jgi:hypothetical protein
VAPAMLGLEPMSLPMSLAHLLRNAAAAETLLTWVALIICFRSSARTPVRSRIPAMRAYLLVQAIGSLSMNILINFHVMSREHRYSAYFGVYWLTFFAGSVAIYFVLQQVFQQSLSPLPGLRRLGMVVFRWIAVVTLVFAVGSSVVPMGLHFAALESSLYGAMRSISIMEICLLVFLALSVHSLGFSFRSRIFGVGLGFGISAAIDLIFSAIQQHHPEMVSYSNLFGQIGTLLALSTWIVYFLRVEPERTMVTLPVTSPLLRWNEIANALGHPAGQVVLSPPASTNFLHDVEKAVDKVLAKNALNKPHTS